MLIYVDSLKTALKKKRFCSKIKNKKNIQKIINVMRIYTICQLE